MRMISFVLPIVAVVPLYVRAAPATGSATPSPQVPAEVVKRAEADFRQAEQEQAALLEKVQALRDDIRNQTGRVEVTPDGMRQLIDKLQDQKEQLELEEAGAQGRRAGLLEAIDHASAEMQKRAQADGVADELQKVVAARESEVARMQQLMKAGNLVSTKEFDEARANLAQARAESAMARQRATSAGNDVLDQWNRELLKLTVDQQDRGARLHFLAGRLAKLTPVLGELDQLDRAKEKLTQADRRFDQTQAYVQRLRIIRDLNRDVEDLQNKLKDGSQP